MDASRIYGQADYAAVLKKVSSLIDIDPEPGSAEGLELRKLGALVEEYEAQRYSLEFFSGAESPK